MVACPACGKELPGEFPFCPFCGAPVGEPVAEGPVAEERKVVSVLFCDLVGFTALSEAADPEDVARMLAAYFEVARAQIAGHGGVVEKFIGDAVVGVFGVPAAHEDDPERAVRAGLRIVEDAERLHGVGDAPLRLRVGVNTGEALVRLDVSPGSGEGFLAGDAINTAARIQSVAPVNGVAVGLATYEATGVVFDYTELEPATLKGKSEPVRVFQALASRARLGTDLTRTHDSPFVGREIDLALLKGLFDKTVAAQTVQLVTVVGEPGLGKSRIVAELVGHAQAREPLLTWRQGRCLPYGDGITFWALGEIVKAQAGILESDDPQVASTKLHEVVVDGVDREWLAQRLLPLIGVDATSKAEREELFTAWRTFLEQVAERSPTVLLFEDIHWADDALLAFLEHLADRAEGVPLLVVCTARPELYERHATFGAGLHNANRINLAPLSDEETARLVSASLDATVLPDELRGPIVERAEGNPLYAEEFVRLLKDQDLLVRQDDGWVLREGAEVPLPGSIQALIAARLDTLPAERKALLADAAVVGKVFWAGAVAQMGDRDLAQVIEVLRELGRKELVRPARRSSMEGEAEYAFWHVLTRDVAYNQIPRASRAARHVAAATWLEAKAGDRVEDISEVLAHHYTTALDLAQAVGDADTAAVLGEPALRFLTLAGKRTLDLDIAAALSSYERALTLAPPGHPARAEVLQGFGTAAVSLARFIDSKDAFEEALAIARERGDAAAEANALVNLAGVAFRLGDNTRRGELQAEALVALESFPACLELVDALAEMGATHAFQGDPEAGLDFVERALALAVELEEGGTHHAWALSRRALARGLLGDERCLADFREAIVLAAQAGSGDAEATSYLNLSSILALFEGPAPALEVARQGIAFAEARGLMLLASWMRLNALENLLDLGELDEALHETTGYTQRLQGDDDVVDLVAARVVHTRILALRGQGSLVADTLDWLESRVHGLLHLQWVVPGLGASALARAALGQNDTATALLTEIEAYPNARNDAVYAIHLPAMVRTALATGNPELAERLAADVEARWPYAEHALVAANAALAEADGNRQAAAAGYADAAERWEAFGVIPEQAFAHLGHGRCLLALDDPTAAQPLHQARDLFIRLQAAPHVAECDTLLAQAAERAS